MKQKLFWIFLLATVSCEKNVTIKVPQQDKKIVVNALVQNGAAFRITVGQSTGILDLTAPDGYKVNNAFVQLYEDNVLKDTLVYDSASGTYLARRNTRPQQAKAYRLNVMAPGFASASTETVSPKATVIQSVTRVVNVKKDADGNLLDELRITFKDDGTSVNNYLFRFRRPAYFSTNTMVYNGIYCMHSADVDIERRNNDDPVDIDNCINQQFFMNDANFNGTSKELLLFINHADLEPVLNASNNRLYRPFFELQSITTDHYKYLKSYNTYRDADGNPFAEPVLVYSNVKNGYGIFATYEQARDTIRL